MYMFFIEKHLVLIIILKNLVRWGTFQILKKIVHVLQVLCNIEFDVSCPTTFVCMFYLCEFVEFRSIVHQFFPKQKIMFLLCMYLWFISNMIHK
jgi:hypothetical protein